MIKWTFFYGVFFILMWRTEIVLVQVLTDETGIGDIKGTKYAQSCIRWSGTRVS